jgi:hypothetical protein
VPCMRCHACMVAGEEPLVLCVSVTVNNPLQREEVLCEW